LEYVEKELIHALNNQFEQNTIPGIRNELNYEDVRHALAAHLQMLLKENKDYLYAQLYRIDVSEKDVRMALSQNLPHYILAELILKKLNEKIYWRKKYSKDNGEIK
jgi:hypothetical protein